jgi:hypothetical protein
MIKLFRKKRIYPKSFTSSSIYGDQARERCLCLQDGCYCTLYAPKLTKKKSSERQVHPDVMDIDTHPFIHGVLEKKKK